MYTKEYLKKQGYEFKGSFGYTSEIWVRKIEMILVDVNTRQIVLRFNFSQEVAMKGDKYWQKKFAKDLKELEKKYDTDHHICPHSRNGKRDGNIARVNNTLHQDYHILFENRTPEEIIDFLNTYFWSGKYEISITKK